MSSLAGGVGAPASAVGGTCAAASPLHSATAPSTATTAITVRADLRIGNLTEAITAPSPQPEQAYRPQEQRAPEPGLLGEAMETRVRWEVEPGRTVRGQVVDANGVAVPRANVEVVWPGGYTGAYADVAGNFVVTGAGPKVAY